MGKKGIAILLFLLAAGAFYWYEVRPNNAKSECSEVAKERAREKYINEYGYGDGKAFNMDVYEWNFEICMHSHGL